MITNEYFHEAFCTVLLIVCSKWLPFCSNGSHSLRPWTSMPYPWLSPRSVPRPLPLPAFCTARVLAVPVCKNAGLSCCSPNCALFNDLPIWVYLAMKSDTSLFSKKKYRRRRRRKWRTSYRTCLKIVQSQETELGSGCIFCQLQFNRHTFVQTSSGLCVL